MHVKKEKLPTGFSYPLQTSALTAALELANITLDCSLSYNRRPSPFTAHFWPPNENVPYERLYLTVGAVASSVAAQERQNMNEVTLPTFVLWIRAIISQPLDSPIRREKQLFLAQE